jgi:hypothetical protein
MQFRGSENPDTLNSPMPSGLKGYQREGDHNSSPSVVTAADPAVAGRQGIRWYPTKRFLLYAMSGYWHYAGIHSSLSKSFQIDK